MAATEITKKIYRPLARVGKFYAAVYGSSILLPMGNVLEASTEQTESVEKQDDMTALGGGNHAEMRRVTGVMFKAKLADLNVVNLTRALRGTVTEQDAGTVTDCALCGSRTGHADPAAAHGRDGADGQEGCHGWRGHGGPGGELRAAARGFVDQ